MNSSLDQFKLETAAELGIPNYDQIDKGLLPSRVNGLVGGMMVRKMINLAESVLSQNQSNITSVAGNGYGVTVNEQQRVIEALNGMNALMGTNQNYLPQASVIQATQLSPQEFQLIH